MKRNKFNLYGNKILLSILIKYLFFHSAIRQNMLISHTRKSCLNIHILRIILSLRILENILIAFRERNHPTVSSRSRWIVSYPSLRSSFAILRIKKIETWRETARGRRRDSSKRVRSCNEQIWPILQAWRLMMKLRLATELQSTFLPWRCANDTC